MFVSSIFSPKREFTRFNVHYQFLVGTLHARESARTLRIYIYVSFDIKTCYSFNGSEQYKNILNGSGQFLTGTSYQVLYLVLRSSLPFTCYQAYIE